MVAAWKKAAKSAQLASSSHKIQIVATERVDSSTWIIGPVRSCITIKDTDKDYILHRRSGEHFSLPHGVVGDLICSSEGQLRHNVLDSERTSSGASIGVIRPNKELSA